MSKKVTPIQKWLLGLLREKLVRDVPIHVEKEMRKLTHKQLEQIIKSKKITVEIPLKLK